MKVDYFIYSLILIILGRLIYEKSDWLIEYVLRKAKRIFWIYLIIIFGFFLVMEKIRSYRRQHIIEDKVETLIHSNVWMSYDPSEFNPFLGTHPTKVSIENDLKIIKDLGFDGIITFNCNDYMNDIPQLSKKNGLKIIAGIWNPKNEGEIANAISLQRYVDGYCIGHNGLRKEYSFNDLKRCIKTVRNSTKKPVSSTITIKQYIEEKELINLVDWIFPDGSLPLHDSVNIERDVGDLIWLTKNLNKENNENKAILLKMIIFPYASLKNSSEENQSLFYSALIDNIIDNASEMPANVSISFYGLYDPYWKCTPDFYFWEPYTGLVDSEGLPRKSLNTIMTKLKQIQ